MNIEITEREAIALMAISGRISGDRQGPRGSFDALASRVATMMDKNSVLVCPYELADKRLDGRWIVSGGVDISRSKAGIEIEELDQGRDW